MGRSCSRWWVGKMGTMRWEGWWVLDKKEDDEEDVEDEDEASPYNIEHRCSSLERLSCRWGLKTSRSKGSMRPSRCKVNLRARDCFEVSLSSPPSSPASSSVPEYLVRSALRTEVRNLRSNHVCMAWF